MSTALSVCSSFEQLLQQRTFFGQKLQMTFGGGKQWACPELLVEALLRVVSSTACCRNLLDRVPRHQSAGCPSVSTTQHRLEQFCAALFCPRHLLLTCAAKQHIRDGRNGPPQPQISEAVESSTVHDHGSCCAVFSAMHANIRIGRGPFTTATAYKQSSQVREYTHCIISKPVVGSGSCK